MTGVEHPGAVVWDEMDSLGRVRVLGGGKVAIRTFPYGPMPDTTTVAAIASTFDTDALRERAETLRAAADRADRQRERYLEEHGGWRPAGDEP